MGVALLLLPRPETVSNDTPRFEAAETDDMQILKCWHVHVHVHVHVHLAVVGATCKSSSRWARYQVKGEVRTRVQVFTLLYCDLKQSLHTSTAAALKDVLPTGSTAAMSTNSEPAPLTVYRNAGKQSRFIQEERMPSRQ